VSRRRVVEAVVLGVLLAGFVAVLMRTAWLCDDAYISLRTVDNFVHGHGLRWNVAERVQVYTHPLWVLLLSAAMFVTREAYLTTIMVSIALAVTAVALVTLGRARPLLASVTGLLLCSLSPSFVAYSTSGLENPLSFLLLAVFVSVYLRIEPSPWRPFWLGCSASLALVNRLDLVWLYAPALALELYRRHDRVTVRRLALGFSPLVAWSIFALVYYGFVVPNPAYGKLHTGIDVAAYVRQGLAYFADIAVRDSLTFLTLVTGVALGCLAARDARRTGGDGGGPLHARMAALAAGMLLYCGYLVVVGGDFMRGRFLTVPFLFAVAFLVRSPRLWDGRRRFAVVAAAIVLGCIVPNPTFRSGRDYGSTADPNAYRRSAGIADERAVYFKNYGLLNGTPLADKPGHDMRRLHQIRARDATRIRLVQAAGRSGFIAGPGPHLVDTWGLVDPLTARLDATPGASWRIGHIPRAVPAGYLESLPTGVDAIQDARLRAFAARLVRVTRGPVFSAARWRDIVAMNLGRAGAMIRGYTSYAVLDGAEAARLSADPTLVGPELLRDAVVYHIERADLAAATPVLRRYFEIPADYRYGVRLPDMVEEATQLTAAAYTRGDTTFAVDMTRLLVELAPGRAEPIYALGMMQVRGGQTTAGMELLEDAARKGYAPAEEALQRLRTPHPRAPSG